MLMGAAGTPDFQRGFVRLNSMSEHSGNNMPPLPPTELP